ncbi:hypothetical protein VTJ04DRAFT_9220 [Mycothermus thermophilus]|uniref:uncharacterized protein n=1 Tax=Humicola insolens TaxID=85995 RepID=UPI003742805D
MNKNQTQLPGKIICQQTDKKASKQAKPREDNKKQRTPCHPPTKIQKNATTYANKYTHHSQPQVERK